MFEVYACVGFLCRGRHWEISRQGKNNNLVGIEKMLLGIFSWKGAGRKSPAKVENVAAVNGNHYTESCKKIGLNHQIGLFWCLAGVHRNHFFGCWTGRVSNLNIQGNGGFSHHPPLQLMLPEQGISCVYVQKCLVWTNETFAFSFCNSGLD